MAKSAAATALPSTTSSHASTPRSAPGEADTPSGPSWQLALPLGPRLLLFELACVWLCAFVSLVALVVWHDNAQGITGNGIFKAIVVRQWATTPDTAPLDPSNYLYYPLMGRLCWLLDGLGFMAGDPRRQLAFIHTFFGAASVAIIYLLIRQLTASRAIAAIASLFHFGGAFFLYLSISNEDIVPSYTLILASMAMASLWFARPRLGQVAMVGVVFTLGWLMEWRLMFPTIPALLVALGVSSGSLATRALRIAAFLATGLLVAALAHLAWGSHAGNPYYLSDLIWTGKGVDSGYAGFATRKLVFLWIGISESLVGGRNLASIEMVPTILGELVVSTCLLVATAAATLALCWKNRSFVETRIVFAVFAITFAAGEFMNLYSQPQDPQMQINVMSWVTVGLALVVAHAARRYRRIVLPAFLVLSLGILVHNAHGLVATRGEDARWREALGRMEREVDPANTFLLVQGFEPLVSQTFYHWKGEWRFFETLGPAPTPLTKFKILALVSGPVNRPRLTPEQQADELKGEIEKAMSLGYNVVAVNLWGWSEEKMALELSTVANHDKAAALYRMLHTSFVGIPLYEDPVAGTFVRLVKAPR